MPEMTFGQVLWQMQRQMNKPLLITALAAYAAAFIVVRLLRRAGADGSPSPLSRINASARGWRRAVAAMAVVYVLFYSYLSIMRYYKMLAGTWDLAIFDSLYANALHGRFFQDYRGMFDHFEPLYVLLLPFYAAWPDPRMLLILKSVIFAVAAWPLYLLVTQTTRSRAMAGAIALCWLLYPLVGSSNIYDFHTMALSPAVFFAMLYFMAKGDWRRYWVFLALVLLVKESEAILVLGAGLYLMSRRDYRRGAITAAVAIAWFFGTTILVIPAITGEGFRHFGRYTGATSAAEEALKGELGRVMAAAYAVRIVAVMAFCLLPVALLPARRWRTFVLVFLPTFVVNVIAHSFFQNTIFGHYGITVSAAVFGAAALAVRDMPNLSPDAARPSAWPVFLVTSALLMNFMLSYPANHRFYYYTAHLQPAKSGNFLSAPLPLSPERGLFYSIAPRERMYLAVKDSIPRGSTVAAQFNLGYFFANDYILKDPAKDVVADYYLFDIATGGQTGSLSNDVWLALYWRFANDKTVVRFLDTSTPGKRGGGYIFYATGDKWLAVYANLRDGLARRPDDIGYRLAVEAVERTMRIGPGGAPR